MPPRRRAALVWCIALAALTIGLFVALRAGALDRLLPGGAASHRRAEGALALYAALAWLATGLVLARPRQRKGALLALASIALALVAFDLWARATDLPLGLPRVGNMGMFSRAYHHRYPADAMLRLGSVDGEMMVVRTNEDGLRTSWSRASFQEHSPRIAVLGDSFVFGMGVRQGEEFPVLLQRLLREKAGLPDVAVLDAGIVSYSPYLERWLYRDVVGAYRPQLVLEVIDVTDIGDDLKYENESVSGKDRPEFRMPLEDAADFVDHGPLWNLSAPLRSCLSLPCEALSRALHGAPPADAFHTYAFDLVLEGQRETNQYFIYRHPLEVTRPYFERTLRNLVALAKEVRASGASFAAIVIPRYQHWNPRECPDNWEGNEYSVDDPYRFEFFRFWGEARERVDFPIYDLLPAFQATDEFPLVLHDDPHWNPAGHAFVARTLLELLQREKLLEPLRGN